MEITNLKAVEIEINSHCNKSCSYCPNSVDERIEKGQMEPEVYFALIQQLKDIGFAGRISYDFYNEPLLCRHLNLFISHTLKELPQVEIHLYSNGSLIDLEKFRELRNLGVKKFVITKHEDYFQDGAPSTPYTFEKTLSQLSSEELQDVVYRDFEKLVLTNRGGTLEHLSADVDNVSHLPCLIPAYMLTVTVKGSVVPCFEDFYQKNMMGNIMQEHLKDIWKRPEYIKMRKALMLGQRKLFDVCATCSRKEVLPEGKD